MHETFRMKRSIRNEILFSLPCFLIIGTLSVFAFLFDPKGPHPRIGALALGGFWSCWVVAGVWCLLIYWKYRLIVDGDLISKVGVFKTKEIQLGDVTSARWRSRGPSGDMGIIFGIVLRSPAGKLSIGFRDFEDDVQSRLIAYFRGRLDPSIQAGWDRVALVRTLKSAPKVAVRGYWDFFFLNYILIMAPFLVFGTWDKAKPFLGSLLAMWGLIRLVTRGRAEVVRAESKTEVVRQTRGLLIIAAIAMTVLASARVLVVDDLIRAVVKLATILLWFFGNLIYWLMGVIRMNRRDRESILSRGSSRESLRTVVD